MSSLIYFYILKVPSPLPQDKIDIIENPENNISFEQAKEIFDMKSYEDPAMRGRQSVNPLKKFGFVAIVNQKVRITELGKLFLAEDFDLGEIFLKAFLKWQIPNLSSQGYQNNEKYNIKPFIGMLHLINAVNQKEMVLRNNPKGISKKEFSLFLPTLVHHRDIDSYAEKIVTLREKLLGRTRQEGKEIFNTYKEHFARKFLESDSEDEVNKLLKNLQDYGDSAVRYFRLTRYICIRGSGFYIDLESRRSIEINSLLNCDNAQTIPFDSEEKYVAYISNISEPKLPWETTESYIKIIKKLIKEIQHYESTLQKENLILKNYQTMLNHELKNYIKELRLYRRELQNEESYRKSQTTEQIESYIESLQDIFNFEDRSIILEKLSALGLHALDDALKIQPNYPVGDDNEPTFTAPANVPDIECFYEEFNAICEVTMLCGRDQWYNEGQPVMRHLRDFEEKHNDKPSYCLFIAPALHRDTINTFWTAIKYEYEGRHQKIIPLLISQFILILKTLLQMKSRERFLKHTAILRLYNEILDSSKLFNDSNEWLGNIPNILLAWQRSLIS